MALSMPRLESNCIPKDHFHGGTSTMQHPAYTPGIPFASAALDSLDLPLYGATFGEAVKLFFKNMGPSTAVPAVASTGGSCCSISWLGSLASTLMAAGGAVLFALTTSRVSGHRPTRAVAIAHLLPSSHSFPIGRWRMRRFHDANFSGWILPSLLGAVRRVAGRPDPRPDAVQSGRRTLRQGLGLANEPADILQPRYRY